MNPKWNLVLFCFMIGPITSKTDTHDYKIKEDTTINFINKVALKQFQKQIDLSTYVPHSHKTSKKNSNQANNHQPSQSHNSHHVANHATTMNYQPTSNDANYHQSNHGNLAGQGDYNSISHNSMYMASSDNSRNRYQPNQYSNSQYFSNGQQTTSFISHQNPNQNIQMQYQMRGFQPTRKRKKPVFKLKKFEDEDENKEFYDEYDQTIINQNPIKRKKPTFKLKKNEDESEHLEDNNDKKSRIQRKMNHPLRKNRMNNKSSPPMLQKYLEAQFEKEKSVYRNAEQSNDFKTQSRGRKRKPIDEPIDSYDKENIDEKTEYDSRNDADMLDTNINPLQKRRNNALRQSRMNIISGNSDNPPMLQKYLYEKLQKENREYQTMGLSEKMMTSERENKQLKRRRRPLNERRRRKKGGRRRIPKKMEDETERNEDNMNLPSKNYRPRTQKMESEIISKKTAPVSMTENLATIENNIEISHEEKDKLIERLTRELKELKQKLKELKEENLKRHDQQIEKESWKHENHRDISGNDQDGKTSEEAVIVETYDMKEQENGIEEQKPKTNQQTQSVKLSSVKDDYDRIYNVETPLLEEDLRSNNPQIETRKEGESLKIDDMNTEKFYDEETSYQTPNKAEIIERILHSKDSNIINADKIRPLTFKKPIEEVKELSLNTGALERNNEIQEMEKNDLNTIHRLVLRKPIIQLESDLNKSSQEAMNKDENTVENLTIHPEFNENTEKGFRIKPEEHSLQQNRQRILNEDGKIKPFSRELIKNRILTNSNDHPQFELNLSEFSPNNDQRVGIVPESSFEDYFYVDTISEP